MKTIFTIGILSTVLLMSASCSSTKVYQDASKTKALTESGNFTFVAEKANPINVDVVNILSQYPSGAANILNLNGNYTLTITPETITANLPYFGRMFSASLNPNDNGFNFTSKNFTIDESKSTTKKQVLIINLNDINTAQQMYLEIFPGGSTTLSINSKDRQAISYLGYITAISKDSGK